MLIHRYSVPPVVVDPTISILARTAEFESANMSRLERDGDPLGPRPYLYLSLKLDFRQCYFGT